jgi:hypothetical protein
MAALLVQQAVSRMLLRQPLQGGKGLGYPVEASLVSCKQIECVTVIWEFIRQGFGCCKRIPVLARLAELTDTSDL